MSAILFGPQHELSVDQQIISHVCDYFRQKRRFRYSRGVVSLADELERIFDWVAMSAIDGPAVLFSMGILPISTQVVLVLREELGKIMRFGTDLRFTLRNAKCKIRTPGNDELPEFVLGLQNLSLWSVMDIREDSEIHRILAMNPSLISRERLPIRLSESRHGLGLIFASFLADPPKRRTKGSKAQRLLL
jgi:hypothetical protein